ncbi:hypothetical protein N0V93_008113 [Gnomoniopsis smithogilvyi]|uniref:Heterokaryon incompatibility domain-containing protein n=1 Tax=Gnomoniopsis smithogilvyi TaxID=1191159 RepID=A0A9W8YL40_9PEZI|nr:hypothetical protein N0V93_008113 [Gnomoniopsis smithogilvyi]
MAFDVSSVSRLSGRRALQLAIDGDGSIEEIASLLAYEAEDLSSETCDNWVPCDHLTALDVAACSGHTNALGRLLEAGADANAHTHRGGSSVLEQAVVQGQLSAVKKLLERGADPNHFNKDDVTPLIAATKAGHVEICKCLIHVGGDISISGLYRSNSAIATAAEMSNVTLLDLYLGAVTQFAAGFDPDNFQVAFTQGRQMDSQRLAETETFLNRARIAIEDGLKAAGRAGDMLILQRLLGVDLDINIHETIAATAAGGHVDAVAKLIQAASNQGQLPTKSLTRAMQSAVDAGHVAPTKLLLKAGVNATEVDIKKTAASGDLDLLTFLLEAGANAEKPRHKYDDGTALQWAVKGGHEAVVDLLLASGANVNAWAAPYGPGGTALQVAIGGGHTELARRLLDEGADVNALPRREDGDTALQAAARAGNLDMLEILLAAGANVGVAETPRYRWPFMSYALTVAAEANHPEIVARLLEVMSLDDARQIASIALPEAVNTRNIRLVQQLLQLHPHVDILDREQRSTALQIAAANGDLEIVKFLLKEKANVIHNPSGGKTALQSASDRGFLDVVETLLAAGANVNVTGSTAPPLLLAIRNGHIKVFERLLSAGAHIDATSYRGQTMLQAAEDSGSTKMQDRVRDILKCRPQPLEERPPDRGTGPLCEACRRMSLIDSFYESTNGVHAGSAVDDTSTLHPSLITLKASAVAGCPFCCFLWTILGITTITLPQPSPVTLKLQRNEPCTVRCEVKEPFPTVNAMRLEAEFHFAINPLPTKLSIMTILAPNRKSRRRSKGHRVPIAEDRASPQTYMQIRSWLDTCNSRHQKCRLLSEKPTLPEKRILPSRLVYLAPSRNAISSNEVDINLQPRLVTTNGLKFSKTSYVALSYRWPENFPREAKLTQETMQLQMDGLQTSQLPQNFIDAFQIAARMGIKYIWIDSLCIVQDDQDDWKREASLMGQIYRNAYLTIAIATPLTQAHLGLFQRRGPSPVPVERFYHPMKDGPEQEIVVMAIQREQELFFESPLVSRGWCFQERELSRRILHYTASQVLWECRTFRGSEGLPSGIAPHEQWLQKKGTIIEKEWLPRILDVELSGESVEYVWHRAVEDYSARHLTMDTDKLPALAGLAAILHNYRPGNCRYLAGLWEDAFVLGLAWASGSGTWSEAAKSQRYSDYIAPTWSWASVKGSISYKFARSFHVKSKFGLSDEDGKHGEHSDFGHGNMDDKYRAGRVYKLRVLDVHVEQSTADPFGAVRHGAFLRCAAWLTPAIVRPRWKGNAYLLDSIRGDLHIGKMSFDLQQTYDEDGVRLVSCILLGLKPREASAYGGTGLVVIATGNKTNEYRRVGIMQFEYPWCVKAPGFQAMEITIV